GRATNCNEFWSRTLGRPTLRQPKLKALIKDGSPWVGKLKALIRNGSPCAGSSRRSSRMGAPGVEAQGADQEWAPLPEKSQEFGSFENPCRFISCHRRPSHETKLGPARGRFPVGERRSDPDGPELGNESAMAPPFKRVHRFVIGRNYRTDFFRPS